MRKEERQSLLNGIAASARKEEQMLARKDKAEKKLKAQEKSRRTHRLILIGATVESALGYPVEGEMLNRLKAYLIREERAGNAVSKALKETGDVSLSPCQLNIKKENT